MEIYTEFGIGNEHIVSTEVDYGDSEIRFKGFCGVHSLNNPYIRIWMGKRVVIISMDGIKITKKARSTFKCVIGFKNTWRVV